ncbi:exosome component Rrp46 [Phlegmacium glaucopus]|nr:exosome component Rrp46 [Phlegmacium glaucopus]
MNKTTRRRGRENSDTRDIKITYDGLARVDGSARFGFGEVAALASISGPIEVRLASELPSKATFEVILRPLTNVPGTDSKCLAATIRASLEPSLILTSNPRTLIQIVIQSLRQGRHSKWRDSLTAAMINASCLALLNSGSVYMRGVVAAVAIGRLPDGTLVVDPDEEEEECLGGGGCFAFMFADETGLKNDNTSNSDCVWSGWKSMSGAYDESELFRARELARVKASDVYVVMKKSIDARISYNTDTPARNNIEVIKDEMKGENDSDDDRMEI